MAPWTAFGSRYCNNIWLPLGITGVNHIQPLYWILWAAYPSRAVPASLLFLTRIVSYVLGAIIRLPLSDIVARCREVGIQVGPARDLTYMLK